MKRRGLRLLLPPSPPKRLRLLLPRGRRASAGAGRDIPVGEVVEA